MKTFKTTLSLSLAFIVLMTSMVFAEKGNLSEESIHEGIKVSAYSESFPNAYLEQEFFDFSQVGVKLNDDGFFYANTDNFEVLSELSELNADEELLDSIKQQLKQNENANLLGIASVIAYVEETYINVNNELVLADSRLMSHEEVVEEEINLNNFTTTSSFVGEDIRTRERLTLRLAIWEESVSHGAKYILSGNAYWTNGGLGSTSPASGDDYIGFYWGGGYDYSNFGINIVSSSSTYNFLTGRLSDAIPNGGLIWAFNEMHQSINYGFHYAQQTTIGATMTKNTLTGQGNTTSVVIKYIHTYESTKGSISAGVSTGPTGGVSGGFTLGNVDKQWSLAATISGIKF